ncbi:hypothetical protein Lser_V15G11761 [Lactuca serriola]
MILVFFFASALLSCLPFLHSATNHNTSIPICPKSFSCQNLEPFSYPFYNANDTQCGLIKVNCTSNGTNLEFRGDSYEVGGKFGPQQCVLVRNRKFEKLVNDKKCEAFTYNFASPFPLLYSSLSTSFTNVYKCSNSTNYAEEMDAYFNQSTYNRYTRCKAHNLYYKSNISDTTVPTHLPPICEIIQLPVNVQFNRTRIPDKTDIFSLLGFEFTLTFNLSSSCDECRNKDGQCDTRDGHFQCLGTKKVAAEKRHRKQKQILALSIGFVTMMVVIIVCFIWKLSWRVKTKKCVNVENFLENHEFLAKRYTYLQVKRMTNSFEIKLGQGGFGSVYKGALTNGSLVAVKILSELKGNGEDFINEVASVGRTSHVNIVSLVGFCFEGHQRALIYEFMPNGSLEKFIYDQTFLSNSQLGWTKLHEIAIGIARGLEYLHSGCNTRILHFDIKPHNILLDQDFSPKISDFGLAKLFPEKRSMISMSHMRGTPGYIAPELYSRSFGQVSHKSDVYSYGMMILEIVGGRKNIEVGVDHTSEIYFPHWIYKKVELDEDLELHMSTSDKENEMVRKMIIVGLWCIQTNPLSRPTITKVLEMLEGDLESLEIPPKPYLSSPLRSVVGSSFTE